MTRWLLISLCACFLALPTYALASNDHPKLYLEVYHFEEEPTELPQEICWHPWPLTSPVDLPCYAPRVQGHLYYLPLHIGDLNLPTCPYTSGYLCGGYGGYKSVWFGVSQSAPTGHPLVFMSWNACPGFLKGPSAAGEPAACLASTTAICHSEHDHEGYLVYLNTNSDAGAAYFNLGNNADLGEYKVYSCSSLVDEGTAIGGGAQVGGSQTMTCGLMPVQELTWGELKALYR